MSLRMILMFLTLFLLSPSLALAGEFAGTVKYEIAFEGTPPAGMESMIPGPITMFLKGSKTRIDQSMMGSEQIVVYDLETKKGLLLMNMMGQKVRVDLDLSKEPSPVASVEKSAEEMEIAGYSCQKATMTLKDGTVSTVWFTTEIDAMHPEYTELGGFPLEISAETQGVRVVTKAGSVQAKAPEDTVFTPSTEGYTIMKPEDFGMPSGG